MKIEFRIFNFLNYSNVKAKEANEESIYGLFHIVCGGKEYGYYQDDSSEDKMLRGYEYDLSIWFLYLLRAAVILKNNSYCAISDIERMGIWIEFKKKSPEEIIVSIIEDKINIDGPHIRTAPLLNATSKEWSNAEVGLDEYVKEVVFKSEMYLNEIIAINAVYSNTPEILEIKSLLEEVRKIYNN